MSADSAVTYTSVHSEARSWSIPSEDPYEEAAQQLLEQAPRSPEYIPDPMELEDHVPMEPIIQDCLFFSLSISQERLMECENRLSQSRQKVVFVLRRQFLLCEDSIVMSLMAEEGRSVVSATFKLPKIMLLANHPIKINFHRKTKVKSAHSVFASKYGFAFIPHVVVGDVIREERKGKPNRRMVIELEDIE
ncbi:hypothetical protein Tco_0700969 [Tanacetum coccineum]